MLESDSTKIKHRQLSTVLLVVKTQIHYLSSISIELLWSFEVRAQETFMDGKCVVLYVSSWTSSFDMESD